MVLKNSFVENEYENKILFENFDMKNGFFNLNHYECIEYLYTI